ncbi:MAG: efflux RND transporter periplasmic adaptor subunit [Pseudomonadota bacterium]
MRTVWMIAGAVSVAAGAWYGLGMRGSDTADSRVARAPVPVSQWQVNTADFQSRVEALGTLTALESITITANVSETVSELHFSDGQQVEKGDLLVTLQQDEERAALEEQQEYLAEQLREVARLENLVRQNQVAETELDQRRTLAAIAGSRIARERAQIDDRTIRAPFSGVLGLRELSPGALVEPGQAITTLDDVSRVRLDFTVPARFLRFLQTGQTIEATTAAFIGAFSGEVIAVDSRVDPVNRSITARALFDNADGRLKPGMLMQVVVLGERRQAMLIPEESLVSRATDHFVWRLSGDKAERTFVEIGGRRPGWVEITDGLAKGDMIVQDGVARLRGNSSLVTVVES